jgi:hypothetical protein
MYPAAFSSYSYDDSYYSSLLGDLSSLYPSYTFDLPDYYNTAVPKATDPRVDSTASAAPANGNDSSQSGSLSQGAKIGIGVGVPLAVGLLVGIGVFLWCAGKSKGKQNAKTIVLPPAPPQAQTAQKQVCTPNPQGYIQGFQSQAPPPHYAQQQHPHGQAPLAGYPKGPECGVVELEQEYHFARPGAIEMDGAAAATHMQTK